MKILSRLFFAISLLAFATCKKDNPVPDEQQNSSCGWQTAYIDTQLIQNFLFNAGSYWVYSDSVNNSTDSVNNLGPFKYTTTYYFSSQPNSPCAYTMRITKNNLDTDSSYYRYSMRGNMLSMFEPFAYTQTVLLTTDTNGIIANNNVAFLPNYTIGSNTFDSVYYCHFVVNPQNPYAYCIPDSGHVFLKAHMGIIRTDFFYDGQQRTYKLLRYNIQ